MIAQIESGMRDVHECGSRCVCPIHRTALIYAASINDHACQDVECRYGHGGMQTITDPLALRLLARPA